MFACFGIVDERVALRAVDDLEMLCAWLAEYRLGRHGGG